MVFSRPHGLPLAYSPGGFIASNNLRLFTALWGNEAIQNFKDGALKSLLWQKSVLAGSTWSFWTKEEHAEELERLIFNSFDVKFEPHILPDIKDTLGRTAPPQYLLHNPILQEMVSCLQSNSKFLMLPPDTIFGNGTIANILKLGKDPGTCVAVPHMRTFPHLMHNITDEPISNERLCKLAMDSMHPSWIDAEKGVSKSNSFWSGVMWEKVSDGLYSVTHRVPTPYLASFIGLDHAFWQEQATFGSYDHRWPSELVRQGRLRTPGSSDLCMIAEITGPGDNIPPASPPGQDPNGFWRDHVHADHNKQFQFAMRHS